CAHGRCWAKASFIVSWGACARRHPDAGRRGRPLLHRCFVMPLNVGTALARVSPAGTASRGGTLWSRGGWTDRARGAGGHGGSGRRGLGRWWGAEPAPGAGRVGRGGRGGRDGFDARVVERRGAAAGPGRRPSAGAPA